MNIKKMIDSHMPFDDYDYIGERPAIAAVYTLEEVKKIMEQRNNSKEDLQKQFEEKESQYLKTIKELKGSIDNQLAYIEELKRENDDIRKNFSESGEEKWISCFDWFLHSSLNPQAIAKALQGINHPQFPKTERGFWWVFVTILSEINWISKKNYKLVLQWANLHFDCGWDWNKENQFKFSEISDKIRSTPSSEWNKETIGNLTGDYYGALAETMKKAFVEVVNGGKIIDKGSFILPQKPLINDGKK